MTKQFTPNEFKKRKGMSLGEYEEYITKRAVESGLLTQEQIDTVRRNFGLVLGYPLSKSVQLIDNLVKLKLRERMESTHFAKINELANQEGSFIDGILSTSDKIKNEHDNDSR